MPDWFPQAKDVLLLGIAVWGAALSTFNWWTARSKEARYVKVNTGTRFVTYDDGSFGPAFISIQAVNAGHRPVKIDFLAFELPDRRRLITIERNMFAGAPDTTLPVTLADGETASLHIPYAEIGKGLLRLGIKKAKIYPIAIDTIGTRYRGGAWKVDAEEVAGM
ncbi:MAG: hypothetical protein AB7P12_16205 [Alphaproteobacteria bacterium]